MATAAQPRPLSERRLVESLLRSVKHVCETNLVRRTVLDSVLLYPQLAQDLAGEPETTVYSAVRLSGDLHCTIALILPEPLALLVARDMLQYDGSLLDYGAGINVFRDAAGEINNMLAGSFKSALSRSGLHCRLQPPVILNGSESLLRALGKSSEALIARFEVEEFHIRICLWR